MTQARRPALPVKAHAANVDEVLPQELLVLAIREFVGWGWRWSPVVAGNWGQIAISGD